MDCFDSIDSAVSFIITEGKAKTAIAINPEKIVISIKDYNVRQHILNADIRYLDGYGTVIVARLKTSCSYPRIPGCELWENIMEEAGKFNKKVFLVGGTEDIILRTKLKLEKDFNTPVCGYHNGYFDDDDIVIRQIIASKPDIVTVAMGSPKQEVFMAKCRALGLDSFMMGVGGTYDVFTGNVKRAPMLFRRLNLEWFYRLCSQPTRYKRQINLVKFLVLALFRKL